MPRIFFMLLAFFASLLSACAPGPEKSSDSTPPQEDAATLTDTAAPCDLIKGYTDNDGDGYGDVSTKTETCTLEEGQVTDHTDCDDSNADVHPGAPERCNGADDNCNTVADENPESSWYRDADGDGYGDPATAVATCSGLSGYVANATDCDDTVATTHPGADEHCDLLGGPLDENCDGDPQADAVDAWAFYPDADGDGKSTASEDEPPTMACPGDQPVGYNSDHSDCDDADPDVHPGADEWCDDADQDCDGNIDEGAVDADTWYADNDGDGYGDGYGYFVPSITACEDPSASAGIPYTTDGTDCYDYPFDVEFSASTHPGAEEICDEWDNDCDGFTDDDDPDGVTGTATWYADIDGDGYGVNVIVSENTCRYATYALGVNVSPLNTDCNDNVADPDAYFENPGEDGDGDGFSVCDECDDNDWRVNPGAAEVVNGYDDDCDDEIDEIDEEG